MDNILFNDLITLYCEKNDNMHDTNIPFLWQRITKDLGSFLFAC